MSLKLNWTEFNKNNLSIVLSGKTIKLLYNKTPFTIVSDVLYSPFDASINTFGWTKYKSWSISCNLSLDFTTFLDDLSLHIKKLLKEYTDSDEDTVYKDIIYTNPKGYKSLRLNFIRVDGNSFVTTCFSKDQELIELYDKNISTMYTKKYYKAVIECDKLYYYNKKAGSVWNVIQTVFVDDPNEGVDDNVDSGRNIGKYNEYSTKCMIDD